MTDFVYTAIWPVLDLHAKLPALIPDGERELAVMAMLAQVELLGPPRWVLDAGRLIVECPARPYPGRWQRVPPWNRPLEEMAWLKEMAA